MPPEVLCLVAQNQEDEKLLLELEKHLSSLRRSGRLVLRHRWQILPGKNYEQIIQKWMAQASIILLLVSPTFLDSDDCYREMQQAMQQRRDHVIPVLLRSANWQYTPFAGLTRLPSNDKPIAEWSSRDKAWKEVAERIGKVLDEQRHPDTSGLPGQSDSRLSPSGLRGKRRMMAFFLSCLAVVAVILGGITSLSRFEANSRSLTPTTGNTSKSSLYAEQEGTLGSVTYLNPYNLSGEGTQVEAGQWVEVSCKVLAPTIQSVSPDGYWYRIASSPWNNAYYAIANTFMNGDVLGHRPYTHHTDSNVPNCPGA